jgi:hypothetical protein
MIPPPPIKSEGISDEYDRIVKIAFSIALIVIFFGSLMKTPTQSYLEFFLNDIVTPCIYSLFGVTEPLKQ